MRTTRLQRPKLNDPENLLLHVEPAVSEQKKEVYTADRFEPKTYCESSGLVSRTYNHLFRLDDLCRATPLVPGQKARAEKIEILREDLERERQPIKRKTILEYRQKIMAIEHELKQVQKGVFLETFKTLSKDTKANLLALCVFRTMLDGDLKAAFFQMKSPTDALLSEQEILIRLDPQMLPVLEGVGVLQSMSVYERQEQEQEFGRRRRQVDKMAVRQRQTNLSIKQFCDALNALDADEGKLNSQIVHRGTYYNLNSAYWPILDRLTRFLEQNGTICFSRTRMNRQIIDSLYPNQLALLCALNVIESIDSKALKALTIEGLSQVTDFVKSGILHYRIHNDGLCVLREFLKDEQIEVSKSEVRAGGHGFELDVELY